MRVIKISFLLIAGLIFLAPGFAQSPNGTISGFVLDPSGAAIVGAQITVVSDVTRLQYSTRTNSDGIYVVTNLPPGPYRIQVERVGFKTLIKPDIALKVQDALSINFTLPIGAVSETVTISGGAPLVDTESASVSTVVDRNYVENMPLNGRSFQDLILLTPGVVTNSPQVAASVGERGEFSVNGQRTESNYYTVDGVSANAGVDSGTPISVSNSGSLPVSTVLGTTQGLVPVDAMEEFRVQTSTYSAEFGRNPGGQFSFVTRSGTNNWHGTAFDYLRNNVFDANDWFNGFFGKPQPPLRQNDFGGTLGGPIDVPSLYHGKNKTFFFFSYEGLRLIQPQAASVSEVPDTALRQSAPRSLQAVLNAFPLQNGPELGNGLAEFIGTWSDPARIDSYSLRLDHMLNEKLKLFFRFANTPSSSQSRAGGIFRDPSNLFINDLTARTYTVGATGFFLSHLTNEFRLNYLSNEYTASTRPDNFGGAEKVDLLQLQGLSASGYPQPSVAVGLLFGTFPYVYEAASLGRQRQWNLSDTAGLSQGRHQLKFGWDFRRLSPSQYQASPAATYYYFSSSSVQSNSVDSGVGQSFSPAFPTYINFSAFAQDELHLTPRLNFSMGLRWEVNPAPGAAKGNLPYTAQGNSLGTLSLTPQGTPLWHTTWFNLAPRLGLAYTLRTTPGFETVVRGGGGVFFDTGQQLGSYGYNGPGFSAIEFFGGASTPASFPALPAQVTPSIANPPAPPYTTVYAFPPHLQLPFTLQWNASIQQSLGKSQALSVSYVGSNGRRLLEFSEVNVAPFNANFSYVNFLKNGLTSDYNSLQLHFQRRLNHGLQALASYTWSHGIDYGSQNTQLPYLRGDSDYDIRHNFSSAFSYDLPNAFHHRFAQVVLHHWGFDDRFTARTGFPVNLQGATTVDPATGQTIFSGLNLVPGEQLYLYGSQYPGSREINPAAFSLPPGCNPHTCRTFTVGNAPRNFLRGFGAWQMDVAIRREFPIYERLKLQFRAEAFNVFNHPNFGAITTTYCPGGPGCTFGQATATLAQTLGGLSPLYQMGGPRSMQFALKLAF
jgi:hypothetical protein